MQITIHQDILHILDPKSRPGCSPAHRAGSARIRPEYLRAHLEKVAGSDGLKPCVFRAQRGVSELSARPGHPGSSRTPKDRPQTLLI